MTDYIIFALDSRGYKLEEYIQQDTNFNWQDTKHHVICQGGATINILKDLVQYHLNSLFTNAHANHHIHIVLAAGICNLTKKHHSPDGTYISYPFSNSNTHNIISTLQNFKHHFQSQNVSVRIACIPSVSLHKNQEFSIANAKLNKPILSSQEIEEQQHQLNEDLKNINEEIITMNESSGVRNIRWDRDLLRCVTKTRGRNSQNKKKIQKFNFNHLYDGVHADQYLKTKWYYFLCLSIFQDLTMSCQASDSEDDRSWDFKRQRKYDL